MKALRCFTASLLLPFFFFLIFLFTSQKDYHFSFFVFPFSLPSIKYMNNKTQVIKPHQFLTYNSAYRSFDHKTNSSIKVLMINKNFSIQLKVLYYVSVFSNQSFYFIIFVVCMQKISSSLDRVEESLAEARASIREAILSRNYSTSRRRDVFVPRGSIYRNPHAFHQLSLKDSEVKLHLLY